MTSRKPSEKELLWFKDVCEAARAVARGEVPEAGSPPDEHDRYNNDGRPKIGADLLLARLRAVHFDPRYDYYYWRNKK